MSTAASDETLLTTNLEQLRRNLPEQAQRHLDALKGAIELRLSALEAALSDPSRSDALEELILDLARVATVEAQAAATKACVDTQIFSETQKARAAASAQQVLQQERAAGAELRNALDQAQQKLAKVETDLRAELRLTRESLDAELVRSRTAAADAERALTATRQEVARVQEDAARALAAAKSDAALALADVREKGTRAQAEAEHALAAGRAEFERVLASTRQEAERTLAAARQESEQARRERDQERAATAELRKTLGRVEERLSDLGKDHAQVRAAHEESAADLARARDAVGELQQSLDRARAELATERTSAQELRRVAASAADRLAILEGDHAKSVTAYQALQAAHEELKASLEQERTARADVDARLTEAVTALEGQRRRTEDAQGRSTTLQHQLDQATMQLQTLGPEQAEARASHARLVNELARERDRNSTLKQARVDLEAQLAEIEPERDRLRGTYEAAVADLSALQERVRGLEQAHAEAQQQLESERHLIHHQQELEQDLAAARERILSLEAELDQVQNRLSRADGERAGAVERLNEIEAQLRKTPPVVMNAPRQPEPQVTTALDEPPTPMAEAPLPPPAAAPSASPTLVLEEGGSWVPVRLADRFRFSEPLTLPINGDSGLLCDLSILGCQVVANTALKPGQKLKVVLPTDVPLTCTGKVMWARLEPSPKGRGFGYRAGVQFVKPATDQLAAFIEERRRPR